MKLVLDMNLSPAWVEVLKQADVEAVHWMTVGPADAPDQEILAWARENDAVVFTNDLDFSRILALTGSSGPSVVQIRGEDLLPETMGPLLVTALEKHADSLQAGALLVIDADALRVRVLPI